MKNFLLFFLLVFTFFKADSQGVTRISDINSGPGDSSPKFLTQAGSNLFFTAYDGGTIGRELYKSDGTTSGTVLVKDIHPSGGTYDHIFGLTGGNNLLFFYADDGTNGFEPWISDGSASGTFMLKDIIAGSASSSVVGSKIAYHNGYFYFTTFGNGGSSGNMRLWRSDGTSAGTILLTDTTSGNQPTQIYDIVGLDSIVVVLAYDQTHGECLWKSNGSKSGTQFLVQINATSGSGIDFLTKVDDAILFAYNQNYNELWKTNGTASGTLMIKRFPWPLHALTEVNNALYFASNDSLYLSDGTHAGTKAVHSDPNWEKLYTNREIEYFSPGGGLLYFSAFINSTDRRLWRSDGTSAGTFALQYEKSYWTDIYQNGTFFFSRGAASGYLHKSHGTVATTSYMGLPPYYIADMTIGNGRIFFRGTTVAAGAELYVFNCAPTIEYSYDTLCAGDSLKIGNRYYHEAGLYFQKSFSSASGCDSNQYVHLSVSDVSIDTSIGINGSALVSNELNASYQWIDCDSNKVIDGANSRTFAPTKSGRYAVELTKNGCSGTSGCVYFNTNGLAMSSLNNSIRLYPNPTNGNALLEVKGNTKDLHFEVCTMTGQIVQPLSPVNGYRTNIVLPEQEGLYLVRILGSSGATAIRVMKN